MQEVKYDELNDLDRIEEELIIIIGNKTLDNMGIRDYILFAILNYSSLIILFNNHLYLFINMIIQEKINILYLKNLYVYL